MGRLLGAILLFAGLPGLLLGQKQEGDEQIGIFRSVQEYHQFMGSAKRVAYGENGSPELQAMIPMINDIVLDQPIGSTAGQYNAQASNLGMLRNENVRAELEMVDEQYEELTKLGSAIQKRTAEQLRNLDFSDRDGIVDQIRDLQKSARDELNGLLLPHQLKRLKQIRMQSLLRRRSLVEVLSTDPLKSELEISDSQASELNDAHREIELELAKKIQKLRQEAQDKLLDQLKPKQKAEVKEMIGDRFDFSSVDEIKFKKTDSNKKRRFKKK